LLTEDILAEYNQIQEYLNPEEKGVEKDTDVKVIAEIINNKEPFF